MKKSLIVLVVFAAVCLPGFAQEPRSGTPGLYPDASRLTLREAERLFAERNRELLAAQRQVQGAEADRLSAAARPNPVLGISTSGTGSSVTSRDNPHSFHFADAVVGLSQTFERGNKRGLRMDAADFGIQASRDSLADVRRTHRVVLAAAYYDLLFAQDRVRIADESVQLYRRTVAASELRLKAGDIAAASLARIRVDALRAENEARLARADLERAQVALAYLVGLEAVAPRLVADDTWPNVDPREQPDLEQVLARRADVQAAMARVQAAEKLRELAKALRTRDVTLGVQYEKFRNSITGDTVGFAASVPLFTNYFFEGEIARAEVEYAAAQDNVERVRALAIGDVQRAAASLDAAADRLARFRSTLLNEAERAAKGAEFAFEKGAAGVLELLDARRTLYATRVEAVAAQSEYAQAVAAWRAALGEGAHSDATSATTPVLPEGGAR